MIDMIMFGWTFRWFHQKKRLSSDAGVVEYEGFWFAVKLITRVFSWPFDWFHGATYSPWLISFLERTSESLWYSKCQPLIFPQGKLLSYSKTLFTMFLVLLAQFSQIIFCWSAFFIQLYANKDFQSSCELATWANSKFQRLSTHITRKLLLSILERYRPRKQFSLRSGHLYFYTIQSLRTVYFSVLSNNLQTNVMNNIFLCQHFTKRIQSSADGTSQLVTSSVTCLWAFSCASVLTHQSTCGKSNQFTNLQTHSGLEGTCLFRKKVFQFELLFYCLLFANLLLWILTCLTWAQPSHTHKNWTNRETRTTYQKWSRISLWLCWISERAFVP